MCTVSLIWPTGRDGLIARLVFNRDELRTRRAALPPQVRSIGERRVILPVDGQAGGTWIAANDAGVVGALINQNPRNRPPQPGRRSRGMVLPAVMHCGDAGDAIAAAAGLPLVELAPFRLLLLDRTGAHTLSWDATSASTGAVPAGESFMMTSSGLGDHAVDLPRRRLFDQTMQTDSRAPQLQDLFHRHHWPDQPHLSVNMNRYDARTVSMTTVELRDGVVRLSYVDLSLDVPVAPVIAELDERVVNVLS